VIGSDPSRRVRLSAYLRCDRPHQMPINLAIFGPNLQSRCAATCEPITTGHGRQSDREGMVSVLEGRLLDSKSERGADCGLRDPITAGNHRGLLVHNSCLFELMSSAKELACRSPGTCSIRHLADRWTELKTSLAGRHDFRKEPLPHSATGFTMPNLNALRWTAFTESRGSISCCDSARWTTLGCRELDRPQFL
jgi:hypothetical protein